MWHSMLLFVGILMLPGECQEWGGSRMDNVVAMAVGDRGA